MDKARLLYKRLCPICCNMTLMLDDDQLKGIPYKKPLESAKPVQGLYHQGEAESLSALFPAQRLGWLRERAGY